MSSMNGSLNNFSRMMRTWSQSWICTWASCQQKANTSWRLGDGRRFDHIWANKICIFNCIYDTIIQDFFTYIINCRCSENDLATHFFLLTEMLNITPSMISVSLSWTLGFASWHGKVPIGKSGGHSITHLGGIKQYKSMVTFRDFPSYNTLFGLIIQWPLSKSKASSFSKS